MSQDFMTVYVADGLLSLKDAGELRLPEHIFGTKTVRYNKGLRLEIPAILGTYAISYIPDIDMELFEVHVASSGYCDLDYWNLYVNGDIRCETIYTKELHEEQDIAVTMVPAGTEITFEFVNDSETSKIVYIDLVLKK